MRLSLILLVIVLVIGVLAVMIWKRNTSQEAPAGAPSAASGGSEAGGMPMGGDPHAQAEAADPGVEWHPPSRWITELAQGMRLASYVIPPASGGGESAQCAVYYFGPGQGGGVDANLERWTAEFEQPASPKRSTRKVSGMPVTQVEVTGAYTAHAMAPGEAPEAKSDWTLLGAIVEGPSGAVFFKLTGPAPVVAAAAKEFDAMLGSLHKK
jgi:hypothetical protein